MAVHWVSYDLKRPHQQYASLISYLESLGPTARPLATSFFVETTLTVTELRDGMKPHLDKGDEVIVVRVDGRNWASRGVPPDVTQWMRRRI